MKDLSDEELYFSVGSFRPARGTLYDLIGQPSDEKLKADQGAFDAAVDEMERRDREGFFPFHIPRRGK